MNALLFAVNVSAVVLNGLAAIHAPGPRPVFLAALSAGLAAWFLVCILRERKS